MDATLKAIRLNQAGIERFSQNQLKEAIACYREALQVDPDAPYTYNNLGLAFYAFGLVEEAVECCKQALERDPNNLNAWSNLLYYLHYRNFDRETVFQSHLEFGKMAKQNVAEAPEAVRFPNRPKRGRPLRIGYLSPDFRGHSVAYFLEPVLKSHDHARFQIFGYANVPAPDLHTLRFRTYCDGWHSIHGMPDEEVGALIRADEIDILVDLAGHTSENRLPLFARRWAPVQMTWLGYFDTTGLSTVDYLVTDPVSSPKDSDQPFTERLLRLPHVRLCYQPPLSAPPVAPLPSLASVFTFGCFNNFAKLSEEALSLWARILRGAPDSRLLLKAAALGNADVRERVVRFFEERGIAPERLILRGISPFPAMLEEYGEVDVALDPFPFTGGLTTCEALWQGVPVLTLAGDSLISRQSASFLHALGMEDWIAPSLEAYERKAIALASNPAPLAPLRTELRPRMAVSPICDRVAFTRALEALYRQAWRAWCRRNWRFF